MTPEQRARIEGFTDRDLLIELYTMVDNMQDVVHQHHEQIHGNGQPGIKDRLAKLEERTAPGGKTIGVAGVAGAIITVIVDKFFVKFVS